MQPLNSWRTRFVLVGWTALLSLIPAVSDSQAAESRETLCDGLILAVGDFWASPAVGVTRLAPDGEPDLNFGSDIRCTADDPMPAIDPIAYRLELHQIAHPEGRRDLVVVEIVVPRVKASMPYFTGGNDAFVRLDGVKRKLAGPELAEWIVRRMSGL